MKVIVLGNELKEKQKDLIKETAASVGAELCFAPTEADIPDDFKDAEVLYGFGMKTVSESKALKWLCVPSAGVDFLLKPGVFANEDCLITNSAGAYGVSIAEHIIMVSLMMMRRMTVVYRDTIAGKWGQRLPQKSLKDCRITVLGTGDIGCTFATRVKAFEPAGINGVCRTGVCPQFSFDRICKTDELDEVLPETDLLVMSLPDTSETRGILSAERMALLPDGAYVVNVGRGSAIDEKALIKNLESEHLAGAALDVFATEPIPEGSELWTTKNLLITPHVAGNMTIDHTIERNAEMFCEDLIAYSKGKPMKHIIDKKLGY